LWMPFEWRGQMRRIVVVTIKQDANTFMTNSWSIENEACFADGMRRSAIVARLKVPLLKATSLHGNVLASTAVISSCSSAIWEHTNFSRRSGSLNSLHVGLIAAVVERGGFFRTPSSWT